MIDKESEEEASSDVLNPGIHQCHDTYTGIEIKKEKEFDDVSNGDFQEAWSDSKKFVWNIEVKSSGEKVLVKEEPPDPAIKAEDEVLDELFTDHHNSMPQSFTFHHPITFSEKGDLSGFGRDWKNAENLSMSSTHGVEGPAGTVSTSTIYYPAALRANIKLLATSRAVQHTIQNDLHLGR